MLAQNGQVRATLDLWILAYLLRKPGAKLDEVAEFARNLPGSKLLIPEDTNKVKELIDYFTKSGFVESKDDKLYVNPKKLPAPLARAAEKLAKLGFS